MAGSVYNTHPEPPPTARREMVGKISLVAVRGAKRIGGRHDRLAMPKTGVTAPIGAAQAFVQAKPVHTRRPD